MDEQQVGNVKYLVERPWKKPKAGRWEQKHARAGFTTNKMAQAKARKQRKKRTRR